MSPRIKVKDLRPVNLEGGYLIDGFPSVGYSSAIASESMTHTSKFEMVAVIDSDAFPPISVIRDGKPNYPTRIFANEELKVGVFLSYLTLDQSFHKAAAKTMLEWARDHKIDLIISSVAVNAPGKADELVGIGSTDSAREKARQAGLKVLENGTVPGIPGTLLNRGSISGQDVIVIVFHTDGKGPDYTSSAHLCLAMSKLVPGASCDMSLLRKEAEKAEVIIREAQEESKHLKDSMYR
ncbi:MAG: proteasome assembly chaperone family protein [Nitrosopumilus sp. B06]|nr:MAG: proteasome assembly chaperone family protein [Nitrosopumilus sp. D6]RNJ79074.1 MAG: proteasome assembly chaperone family protein [Nitrosopumilus sp. B06]